MYICVYSHISVQAQLVSRVRLFATLWTVACQAPLSMVFSRQEYWNGLPFSSPGDLPDPKTEPRSPALQADFYHRSHQGSPYIGISFISTMKLNSSNY